MNYTHYSSLENVHCYCWRYLEWIFISVLQVKSFSSLRFECLHLRDFVFCFEFAFNSILSVWNDMVWKDFLVWNWKFRLPCLGPWVKKYSWNITIEKKKKSVFESENIEITLETSWLYLSIAKSKSKASCKKKLLSCQWPLPNHHDQKLHKTWKRWRSNWSVFITARAQQIQDGTGDFRE